MFVVGHSRSVVDPYLISGPNMWYVSGVGIVGSLGAMGTSSMLFAVAMLLEVEIMLLVYI